MPPEAAPAPNSAIYVGDVFHRRVATRRHNLRYRVFYLLLDLDEALPTAAASRLFGWNRPAWLSFHDADHGAGDGRPLRDWLDDTLHHAGLADTRWQYRILCMPRVAGYVFNPISVIYCYRADGQLGAMVYEVNNTFGERLSYVLPVGDSSARIRQSCEKALFVSPFFDLSGHYEFDLSQPTDKLTLRIDYRREGNLSMRAAFSGRRLPFTAANLRSVAMRYPAATLKVIAAIHFEALKLWLKGIPLVKHVKAGDRTTAIGNQQ